MRDSTVKKIEQSTAPIGDMGEKVLVSGKKVAMRLWSEDRQTPNSETIRDYETVGYVIDGIAELEIEQQKVLLQPGDSWLVPPNARHRYHILEPFTAIEATTPPARLHSVESE